MPTAEQLLQEKKICEQIPVRFPTGTLFEPLTLKTQGTLYKSLPTGTYTLAVSKGNGNGFEYYLADVLGNVFVAG